MQLQHVVEKVVEKMEKVVEKVLHVLHGRTIGENLQPEEQFNSTKEQVSTESLAEGGGSLPRQLRTETHAKFVQSCLLRRWLHFEKTNA